MNYYQYIKSTEWKDKKKSLSGIGGRRCWICNKKKVEAHHATYKRLGNENIHTDLYFLCRQHHQEVHDFSKTNKLSIYIATKKIKQKYAIKWNGRERWNYWNKSKKLEKIGL